jgi:hypothetical protein
VFGTSFCGLPNGNGFQDMTQPASCYFPGLSLNGTQCRAAGYSYHVLPAGCRRA